MADQSKSADILGTEPIRKLVVKLSVPAVVAMFVNALYNVVDTIYVGQGVGPLGIGGIAVAFPLQMVVMALAMMFGIGSASIVSRALGAGDKEKAVKAVGNGLILALFCGICLTVIGYLFMEELLIFFGATEALLVYSRDYLSVVLPGSIFLSAAMASNNLIRAEGKAKTSMAFMLVGAVSNIILDPIFIFGLRMGIKGAALATVISQFFAFLCVIWFFGIGRKSVHKLSARHFIPDFPLLRETTIIGFPAFVRQFAGSFLTILVNNALRTHGAQSGDFYISAFGVVNRLLMFGLMPLFGIAQGFQPLAGYNYGARRFSRVKESVWVSLKISVIISVVFFLLVIFFTRGILSIFSSDEQLMDIGTQALRIIVMMAPIIGIQVVGATYFQAVGKALPALVLSLSRQVILLIPLLIILPRLFGVMGVWVSFPVADFLSTALTGVWLLFELRRLDKIILMEARPAED